MDVAAFAPDDAAADAFAAAVEIASEVSSDVLLEAVAAALPSSLISTTSWMDAELSEDVFSSTEVDRVAFTVAEDEVFAVVSEFNVLSVILVIANGTASYLS